MKKLLFIGIIGSSFFYEVNEEPCLGKTYLTDSYHFEIGGKAFNQAYMATLLGADACFLSALTHDVNESIIRNDLAKTNVKAIILEKNSTLNNPVASIITYKGQNTVYLANGATLELTDFPLIKEQIDKANIIVINNELASDLINEIINYANGLGKYLIYNNSPALTNIDLTKIDLLIVNEQEAEELNIDYSYHGKEIIITKGKYGACLITKDKMEIAPPIKVNALDSTGAGDVFLGTVSYHLAIGDPLDVALIAANKRASESVKHRFVLNGIVHAANIK